MDFFSRALPLEKICRFLLNEKFAKILKRKLGKEQLNLDVASGTLTVTDVELNPSIFNSGGKSLLLCAAKIGSVQIHMAGKAAKSFFSDTVHDNLIVKVSDIHVELDMLMDNDVALQVSNEEVPVATNITKFLACHQLTQFNEQGIIAAMLAAIGSSSQSAMNVADSWSELEAQMPCDSDGREQLSHIIKQFLLLAEFEVSDFTVICNIFRSGRNYHPSQFRLKIDHARFLNDFTHLKGKSMPSSSVEHLGHIVFGRQFRIGSISVDVRDSLANHSSAAVFENQQWVPIFSAILSPSSNLGTDSVPFCNLQYQLKDFDSDLNICVLTVDLCIQDVKVMLDSLHIQLLLSFAKIFIPSEDSGLPSHHCAAASVSEEAKVVGHWFERSGSVDQALTITIKCASLLVACVDQPLRNKKRRSLDSDWLFTIQGVRIVAGPVTIHATSELILLQELFHNGSRHEVFKIECNKSVLGQQCGFSYKVARYGNGTEVFVSIIRMDFDFEFLHRFNAAFYWHMKSLQNLFSKSPSPKSSLRIDAESVQLQVRLSEDIIQYYHANHSAGLIFASLSGLSLQFHGEQSFDATFDNAHFNLLPDSVHIYRLDSIPNTIQYKKESSHQPDLYTCMACRIILGNIDARLSIHLRPLIFSLANEFAARLPHPPLDPPPLGKNFKRREEDESDKILSRSDSQSSDDDQFCESPMGHESMLRSSIYISAHSSIPRHETTSLTQTSDPTLLPLYLILMKNALHAMGASFSGLDSFELEVPNLVHISSPDISLPLNYTFSVLVDNFVFVLAGAATPPDSNAVPSSNERPFFCGFDASYIPKFAALNAVDALVLLSKRLELSVSVFSSPSSTVSELKFGSCQVIDSYDRVHLEPFYPFDGMLPPQSVSQEDRRENGQIVVNFASGGKCVNMKFTNLLLHYGHCNWIASIIQFFTDTSLVDDAGRLDQKNSEDVNIVMTLKLVSVAFQPALFPSPCAPPRRLFIEEAIMSLIPGAEDILKTISIDSKALHLMVAPHVDHVMTCCNRVISCARNAHLNAVELQNGPKNGNSAESIPEIGRILRSDCTLDWQRMLPLDFSAVCGFLCIASVPSLNLVKKESPVGLIFELHDAELIVLACADSLAHVFAKTASDEDDLVIIENLRPKQVDEFVPSDASEEVVLSPHSRLRLVEEEYRTSSFRDSVTADDTSCGYFGDMYGKVKTSMVTHWKHITGPDQVDSNSAVSETEMQQDAVEGYAPCDESFVDISSFSNLSVSKHAEPEDQSQSSLNDANHMKSSFESMLEKFLSWRLDLVNARVRLRVFAGCDFPEYVLVEEDTPTSSAAATSSFRKRDLDRSLELQVEGIHLRYSSFDRGAPISSKILFRAQDIKVADDITDSFFRCLIQKDESYVECGAYLCDAPAVSLTVETLQSCVHKSEDSELLQRRFEAHFLPLFCSLDERTLNAIWDIMHVYSAVVSENETKDSGGDWDVEEEKLVYQKFIISALIFRLNYKPIRYPIMLRDSPISLPCVKLWNCPPRQLPENILKQWGGIQEIFKQFLGGVANSVPVVSNVAHIFSALNILVQQCIRNRSSALQVRRHVFAFLSALSGEVIDVGLIATRVADQLLSGTSSVVVGSRRRERRVAVGAYGPKQLQMLQALQEDLKKLQQPENVQEGLQEGIRSFSQGLECMMMTILQPGCPSYIRRGAAAVLMPVQGMNRGVFRFLQGLLNQLQPQRRVRHGEKYKDSYAHPKNA